jgi:carbonic anhydrase
VINDELAKTPAALARAVTRANVRMAADHLRHGSPVIERLAKHGLRVVGAEYDISSGVIDFFDRDGLG